MKLLHQSSTGPFTSPQVKKVLTECHVVCRPGHLVCAPLPFYKDESSNPCKEFFLHCYYEINQGQYHV